MTHLDRRANFGRKKICPPSGYDSMGIQQFGYLILDV